MDYPPEEYVEPDEVDSDVLPLLAATKKAGVGPDIACPICGAAAGWGVYRYVGFLPQSGNPSDGKRVLGLICKGCGFLRLHTTSGLDPFMVSG